jgi:hypothetical protein
MVGLQACGLWEEDLMSFTEAWQLVNDVGLDPREVLGSDKEKGWARRK